MKRSLTFLGIFLAGLLSGVGIMLGVVRQGPEVVIDNLLCSLVASHVRYACLLDENKIEELKSTLAQEIEHGPKLIDGMKVREPHATQALWLVRHYYDKAGKPIPESVKSRLESLPPRPVCPLKTQKHESAEAQS